MYHTEAVYSCCRPSDNEYTVLYTFNHPIKRLKYCCTQRRHTPRVYNILLLYWVGRKG